MEGSKLTFVPDGPGEYVVRVDAIGSCIGQVASSEASLRVDCNRAPVPDAAVYESDDVVLFFELPRYDAARAKKTGPPETPSNTSSDFAFSALDAGERTATYAAAAPKTPRCFKKTVLDGSASRDPEEGRPWRGGDAFVTVWSVVSAPPSSALLGARWTGGARASFSQVGTAATLRPDREGRYACVAETYDGCAEASTKTFFVDVAWDDACLETSRDVMLCLAAPLALAVLCVFASALGGAEPENTAEDTLDDGTVERKKKRRPPLRWTHPSQVALDALACLASREAAATRARVVAESAVDGPRLRHQASFDEDRRKARRDRRRADLIATAFRGDVPAARAKRARALLARRGDASASASEDEDDDESQTDDVSDGVRVGTTVSPGVQTLQNASEEEEAYRLGLLGGLTEESDIPVPPDFDDDSLWDDTPTETRETFVSRDDASTTRDDSATLASASRGYSVGDPGDPGDPGGPGPVVEAFEGLTARVKALLGAKTEEDEDAAAKKEERAKKAKKALRKRLREKERRRLAKKRARVAFLNRVRRVFGFPDAELPPETNAATSGVTRDRAFDSDASDSDDEDTREPRNARERRARETLFPRATRRERSAALRKLTMDAAESAADSVLRLPRRAFFRVYVSVTATRAYLFTVPGGALALLLRAFLVLEFPTLLGVFFRAEAPPFARGGDAGARLAAALTPGWALGANARVGSTYLQLVTACIASCVAAFGPGSGRVCAAVATRAWQHTWVAADAVEAGGVAADVDAASASRDAYEASAAEAAARRAERRAAAAPRSTATCGCPRRTRRCFARSRSTSRPRRRRARTNETPRRMIAWTRGVVAVCVGERERFDSTRTRGGARQRETRVVSSWRRWVFSPPCTPVWRRSCRWRATTLGRTPTSGSTRLCFTVPRATSSSPPRVWRVRGDVRVRRVRRVGTLA